MKRSIRNTLILEAVITGGLGVFFHYIYELSGNQTFVALFAAVNESTWEHLKLLFFPALLSTVVGYFLIGKDVDHFWSASALGILYGMLSIVVLFYTYTGILGYSIDVLNIIIYFIGVIICYTTIFQLLTSPQSAPQKGSLPSNGIGILLILLIGALFVIFTFYTPQIGLFQDPITMRYGI